MYVSMEAHPFPTFSYHLFYCSLRILVRMYSEGYENLAIWDYERAELSVLAEN